MKTEQSDKPLKVGILGLGTVGQALIPLIEGGCGNSARKIEIIGVSARTQHRARAVDISAYPWFTDAKALAVHPELDVFIEVAGGLDTAREAVTAALQAGKHVVTANKAMLAEKGDGLIALAQEHQTMIGFEAAVCGAIPAVKVLRESLAGNQITEVQGIFNGTCNYIFAQMGAGATYAEALVDAQEKGFAEADPALDVGGGDAAHKTALMASLMSGQSVDFDQVYVEGISALPPAVIRANQQNGYVVKLLGQCKWMEGQWAVWVYPAAVPAAHPLAQVNGVTNAVCYQADAAGFGMMTGPGAGGGATASSVMSDVIDIATGRTSIAGGLGRIGNSPILPIATRTGANWVAEQSHAAALCAAGAKVETVACGLIVWGLSEQKLLSIVPNQPDAWLRVEGV